jgi:hypothetical protein
MSDRASYKQDVLVLIYLQSKSTIFKKQQVKHYYESVERACKISPESLRINESFVEVPRGTVNILKLVKFQP